MKFSVIIPIYNRSKLVPICVKRMLELNYKEIEFILIDDGSSDDSYIECKKLSSEFSNVHVYHQENKGVSAARNFGIEKAKGEYLLFVDSDDILCPDSFSFIEQLTATNADMVMFCHGKATPKDIKLLKIQPGTKTQEIKGRNAIINWIFSVLSLYSFRYYTVWGKAIKKRLLDEYKIRFREDVSLGEDQVFICELLKHVNTLVFSNATYYYTISWPKNMSNYALGSSHRSMTDCLYNLTANYDALVDLYYATRLSCVKEYSVNYILDRPVTKILFKNTKLKVKSRSSYAELNSFSKSRIYSVLNRERANLRLLQNSQISIVVRMILNKYPFWLIYSYCFILANVFYKPILAIEKTIRKI